MLEAPIIAIIVTVVPGAKPDLKDAPWDDVGFLQGIWYLWISTNAWLFQTTAFFWTQLFTWGNSSLRDFQLIYMDQFEAGLYFFTEFLFLPITIPFAIIWVCWTWWMYAIWLFYEIFMAFEKFDFKEKAEEDVGMKPKQRRHSH